MKIIPVIKAKTVENNLKKITIKNASKIIIGEIKYQLNAINMISRPNEALFS